MRQVFLNLFTLKNMFIALVLKNTKYNDARCYCLYHQCVVNQILTISKCVTLKKTYVSFLSVKDSYSVKKTIQKQNQKITQFTTMSLRYPTSSVYRHAQPRPADPPDKHPTNLPSHNITQCTERRSP